MRKYSYNYKFNKPWLFKALERDKNCCQSCKSTKNIIVHHIDESRKNGHKYMNNNLDNLKTLCKVCHAEAHRITLKYNNPRISLIIELRENGLSLGDVGHHIGVSRQRIWQILHRFRPDLTF